MRDTNPVWRERQDRPRPRVLRPGDHQALTENCREPPCGFGLMEWRGFRVLMTEKLALELVARFADACEVRGDLDTTVRVHDNRVRIEHGNHPSGLHTDAGEPVPDALRQGARQPPAVDWYDVELLGRVEQVVCFVFER